MKEAERVEHFCRFYSPIKTDTQPKDSLSHMLVHAIPQATYDDKKRHSY